MLDALLEELHNQIGDNDDFEILVDVDNGRDDEHPRSTGMKRQNLLNNATAKYIIFIDDDDWIFPCYIEELLKAYESNADCFAINGIITTNGGNQFKWKLSKDFDNLDIVERGEKILLRTTNHITAVKRKLALIAGFPNKSNAEDKDYSTWLNPHLKTEHVIEPPMYHYRYSTYNKEYT